MRIGFDAKRAFANKTGLGNYSRFVLDTLLKNEKGNEYLAYTPKNNQNLFPEFPENLIRKPTSFLDKKLSAYWRYASVTSQLKKDKVDVFHGLSHEIPQGLESAGIASVVTIHDLIFEKLPSHFKAIDRVIYRHKFKSACKRSDLVIAISEQTKRDLVDLYTVDPDKIKVVYQDCNPIFKQRVDQNLQHEILKQYGIDGPYILCVGTIEERKNQLKLVEAFSLMRKGDFKLVLVGKQTPYTSKILDFVQLNKLQSQVILLQNVPTEHLPALYQAAEIFAYISVYEGFGIPILESLHSGTPVVAAKGSCLEEAGGPGGLYGNPDDAEDIATQLEKILYDSELQQSLISAGKIHAEKFEGKHIASELVALYQEVKRLHR
ncbi:glycosyltransferase family 1 protein [Dyadobacter sp. CY312]|uniref:glycosyltransferase family 4 protein n=1 Tax=Dyadobacter sp. CY312 TaxID=2907303 RepID=UPI001F22D74B|nr:glycosyltransferase family 1 protein [Dyadobacter sp. CY312]MCE7043446.1 glycosyltransferase family 4 protein [Dyadobacter sp. CY312]